MYTSLNICQRFLRLRDATCDEEDIAAVQEEISYLFTRQDAGGILQVGQFANLKNKRFCYRNFDEKSKVFYSIAMKYHRQVEDVLLTDNHVLNTSEIHSYILDLLAIHRHLKLHKALAKNSTGNVNFNNYKTSFLKFTELPSNAVQRLTVGLVSKQKDSTIRGYFHLMLDVMWLLITMNLTHDNESTSELTDLMREVHFITFKCYEKCKSYIVVCSCIKVFWLRVQLFCEELSVPFWELVNTSMGCYTEEFSLCALKFLAELQCYSRDGKFVGSRHQRVQENIEFLNKNWSLLIKNNADVDEQRICKILMHIESLLSDLWLSHSKLEFYYLTWDYYYPKIETIKETRSFQQVLNEIESHVSRTGQNGSEQQMNGYLIFLRMLRHHLRRHPHHWNKFKGRIYTKFPSAKFQVLSEQGVRNLALLFFTLGGVNFLEASGKLLALLKDLSVTKQNTPYVWHIHIYLILQHLEQQTSIAPAFALFGALLESGARRRDDFHLVALFVGSLPSFFRVCDLTLRQSLLIGGWLENYMKSCAHAELVGLLHALATIVERVVDGGVWFEYQQVFVAHVLAPLKRLHVDLPLVGTLAGLIVAHSEGVDDAAEHFVGEAIAGSVMLAFFTTLTRKSTTGFNARREKLALRAWCLTMLVGLEDAAFTQEMMLQVGAAGSGEDALPPFERFLQLVDRDILCACLKDSEGFLTRNLNLHVYTNMALVLHHRARDLYVRTAATCCLSRFVDAFLLPVDVLRGVRPTFVNHVERTWHLFMRALWRLHDDEDGVGDPYVERLLRDLTLRYMPHFGTRPPPLQKIISERSLAAWTFAKIADELFAQGKSKHVGDECVFKALGAVATVLDDFIAGGADESMLALFASTFLQPLYDVYMFKNHKVVVLEMVRRLAAQRDAHPQVRDAFTESLRASMRKHLAFSTNHFFQLCYVLVKIIPDVLRALLKELLSEIRLLESKRGQAFDNHLRQSYDKLVHLCSN